MNPVRCALISSRDGTPYQIGSVAFNDDRGAETSIRRPRASCSPDAERLSARTERRLAPHPDDHLAPNRDEVEKAVPGCVEAPAALGNGVRTPVERAEQLPRSDEQEVLVGELRHEGILAREDVGRPFWVPDLFSVQRAVTSATNVSEQPVPAQSGTTKRLSTTAGFCPATDVASGLPFGSATSIVNPHVAVHIPGREIVPAAKSAVPAVRYADGSPAPVKLGIDAGADNEALVRKHSTIG